MKNAQERLNGANRVFQSLETFPGIFPIIGKSADVFSNHWKRRMVVWVAVVGMASGAWAATNTVTSNANAGAGSLRQAIADAGAGDVIEFNLSAGNETISIASDLLLTNSVTIDGANTAGSGVAVTVQVTTPGTSAWRVFMIGDVVAMPSCTIQNMTIKGGAVTDGGSGLGGGIYVAQGANLIISDSVVSGSTADDGGGIYICNGSSLYATSLIVSNCTAGISGAGGISGEDMTAGGPLSLTNCTIINNTGVDGGGIYASSFIAPFTISGCSINNNTAGSGGGIHIRTCPLSANATITNCTIVGNIATEGAGIHGWENDVLNITHCTISNNTASGNAAVKKARFWGWAVVAR